jgi:hypothetical protein
VMLLVQFGAVSILQPSMGSQRRDVLGPPPVPNIWGILLNR